MNHDVPSRAERLAPFFNFPSVHPACTAHLLHALLLTTMSYNSHLKRGACICPSTHDVDSSNQGRDCLRGWSYIHPLGPRVCALAHMDIDQTRQPSPEKTLKHESLNHYLLTTGTAQACGPHFYLPTIVFPASFSSALSSQPSFLAAVASSCP